MCDIIPLFSLDAFFIDRKLLPFACVARLFMLHFICTFQFNYDLEVSLHEVKWVFWHAVKNIETILTFDKFLQYRWNVFGFLKV